MTGRLRAICLLGATGAIAAVVARLVVWSGRRVPLPADASVAALDAWHRSLGPDDALMVVLWGAAAALAAWVALAMTLQAAAAACGGRALRLTADLLSPRSLQRVGHSLAGLSLTAGLTVAPSAGFLDPPGPDAPPTTATGSFEPSTDTTGTATMVRVDPAGGADTPTTVGPTTTVTSTTAGDAPRPAVDGSEVPRSPSPPAPVAPSTTAPSADAGPGAVLPEPVDALPPTALPAVPVVPSPHAPAPEALPPPSVATIVVEPGMSFWSIAEGVLAEAGAAGAPASDRALHRYWQALIEANRDRLVVPGNADLLLPGQSLVLPPP